MRDLAPDLERLRSANLYRSRRVLGGQQRPRARIDGRELLTFCSNDYLGLAGHPAVLAAFERGAQRYGVGSGAAHLVTGHSAAHHALEEELADFVDRPRALLFSTGYMANLGVISALTGRGDTVFEDRLNHASLIDGALLGRARLRRYPHADPAGLTRMLGGGEAALVATDGVFSMDGDLAPLPALARIAAGAGARLLVDDAHGLGVLGREGRGTLDHFGLDPEQAPILVGTLGKAFGTFGAFVAGAEDLIETLIQRARSYVYTTAPPPALAEATRASLSIARREEWRREHLRALVSRFRRAASELGLPVMGVPPRPDTRPRTGGETGSADRAGTVETPIQPILAGTPERALAWGLHLEARGILVSPIRPPTVPEGSARLRVTFSAAHTDADLDRLLAALADLPDREAKCA
jgi:8-amino-7-oxononanoate synthase